MFQYKVMQNQHSYKFTITAVSKSQHLAWLSMPLPSFRQGKYIIIQTQKIHTKVHSFYLQNEFDLFLSKCKFKITFAVMRRR